MVGLMLGSAWCLQAAAAEVDQGKLLYGTRCAFCHGKTGKGDGPAGKALTPPPPDFTAAAFWANKTHEQLQDALEHGKPNTAMMGFKGSLSPEQISAVLTYLESLKPTP